MRGLVDEGRPDFKLDKAGGYDSPNTALCLVREGDITRRACLSRKTFVAEMSFPAKGTWSCLRADLIHLEILSRRIGLLGEIAHQTARAQPNWARSVIRQPRRDRRDAPKSDEMY